MYPFCVWARLKSTMRSCDHVAILNGDHTSGKTIPWSERVRWRCTGRGTVPAVLRFLYLSGAAYPPLRILLYQRDQTALFSLYLCLTKTSPPINSCGLQQLLNLYTHLYLQSHGLGAGAVAAVALWSPWLSWGPLIARFLGPTWGPSGADGTQVGPMLASGTLLSGYSIGCHRMAASVAAYAFLTLQLCELT